MTADLKVWTGDNAEIVYEQRYAGRNAIVFLHGFNGHLEQWDLVFSHLGNPDQRVLLRLDIPGFGRSKLYSGDYNQQTQATTLIAWLDHLGIEKATLVGVSMGASLAAEIAGSYPDRIDNLMMLAPASAPNGYKKNSLRGLFLTVNVLRKLTEFIANTDLYKQLFPTNMARSAILSSEGYGESWFGRLTRIKVPTVIGWSRGDTVADSQAAELIGTAITKSSIVWMSDTAGHDVLFNDPKTVARIIDSLYLGQQVKDE